MLIVYSLLVLLTLTAGGAAGFIYSQQIIAQSLWFALFLFADALTIILGVYELIRERQASRQQEVNIDE